MTFIIGDLHGNVTELDRLMEVILPGPDDELVFLGDYLDKNTHTLKTLERLDGLASSLRCTFLLGNHEYVWDRYLNHGETQRRDFLLRYGSVETLKELTPNPEALIERDDIPAIRTLLRPYLELIAHCEPYRIVGQYLAIHAGLKPEQINQDPLQVEEANYFLRPEKMDLEKRYLGKYAVVAGHTHLGDEPFQRQGYLNLDLGAGYGRFLGALHVEQNVIYRSDGKRFPITPAD